MKVAALDFGSNTFLCLIADIELQKIKKIHYDEVEFVRLGQELEKNKKFHPEALQRAENCLKKFSQAITKHRPERVLAMATAAARAAENKEELFKLAESYGIPLEIIQGEKEAEITYQGAISGLENLNQNLMVLDIGGRSTEFIFGQGEKRLSAKSFEMGCVRLTEKYILQQPTPLAQLQQLSDALDTYFREAVKTRPAQFKVDSLVAVAGTPTTLVQAEIGGYDPLKIDGYVLTKEKLDQWLVRLQNCSVDEKINMGIPAGRADVLLVGVMILKKTLEHFQLEQMSVSTRGLRYGVAIEISRR